MALGAALNPLGAKTPLQQLEHFRLFMQQRTVPEALAQLFDRCVIQLLLLCGGQIPQIGGVAQKRLGWLGAWNRFLLERRQLHLLRLIHQFTEAAQADGDAFNDAAAELPGQFEDDVAVLQEGCVANGDHQKGTSHAAPVPLQQMQLVHNGFHQLLRVIGQIAADVFQHGRGEHTDGAVLAVDPSRVLGFHPVPGAPGELKPRIGAGGFQPLLQLVGRLHGNH